MRPLSIHEGRDNSLLLILLEIHSDVKDPKILDCTYNTGKMWKDLYSFNPIRMDIDPRFGHDIVGSFDAIPLEDNSLDIIIFDPPHLPTNAASKNSSKIWKDTYGITESGEGREGDNISDMFLPFLKEAKRVLVDGGIVLAKIADIVHNHKYQWHHIHFIETAWSLNMTACDVVIKKDPNAGNLKSSKWENVKHFRKCHCYWIVIRNGTRCEAKKK